jgi:hypothetical protein
MGGREMKWYVIAIMVCLCGLGSSTAQNQPTVLPDAPEPQGRHQSQESGAAPTIPATPVIAQQFAAPKLQTGTIVGNVTNVNDDAVPGASVVLEGPAPRDGRTAVTDDNGFFQLNDLEPGTPCRVTISAERFAKWTSPVITLSPGQHLILTGAKLQIAEVVNVTVASSPVSLEEIATEQLKIEEKQRVFGIIPNFYVVYDHDAVPLTSKLKFRLALKTSFDPVTIAGIAVVAGIKQAGDTPNYVQGAKGYGERFGAIAGDGFSDIMIGGAILPSLLHQDPRYFYQGTGTTKSRLLHALSNAFICKGDNGRLQPNYSSIGGDLASAAIANAYYPASNRGVGLLLGNFLTGTGERMLGSVVQEFLLGRFTSKGKNQN